MTEAELKDRLKTLALRVIKLCQALPKNVPGRAIASQLVRSGTSIGANYRAACRGRSRAEFAAKLGVAQEEADETAYWLELIIESDLLKKSLVQPLLTETDEIVAILTASRKTVGKVSRKSSRPAKSKIRNQKSKVPA